MDLNLEGQQNRNAIVWTSQVKLVTLVEGDPKAAFSIATTPMCKGGRCSISRIGALNL